MLFHPQILPGQGQLVLASVLDVPVTSRTTVITLRNVLLPVHHNPPLNMCMFACVHVCVESKLLFLWASIVGKVTHNKPQKDSCATMTWPHSIVTTVGCHMPMPIRWQ